jgi:N-methylhydantoinase A
MSWRIGVDSGGTFTDICLFDEASGQLEVWKVPSTPDDPSRGIDEGVEEGARKFGAAAADVSYLGHGTTVGTNALIELKGARTGLVTTDGFRDLLEIGRQKRPDLYDLQADKPPQLVLRDLRFEVGERVHHDGTVEIPLDPDEVRKAARSLRAAGAEAVAICFLYGFLRPEHEAAAKTIVEEELPDAFVSASHEVAPEFREYERLSTTTVNAFLGPVMRRYIERLGARLRDLGIAVRPKLTQSNGGILSFDVAARLPVRTVLSGPSTGVVAAQALGEATGIDDMITFDMGGTSSDVALLTGRQCRMAGESVVHGYPIKAPMFDIHAVGAGGGSIAYVDSGGLLKVGPRSAGAHPGPVCYGQGGTEPTVTDANVVLGTLNPGHLLGGRLKLDRTLAERAIDGLAEKLGLPAMETAQGIITVVTANMAKAIRVISLQRGHDPRGYTLVAFGGAGPLHGARLARELDIGCVLVPRAPGIVCALGLLLTDLRADFATSRLDVLDDHVLPKIVEAFDELSEQAEVWFVEERLTSEARQIRRTIDMRYAGQNYELPIALPDGPLDGGTLEHLAATFAEAHKRQYGFAAPDDPVQLVTYRLEASGRTTKARFVEETDAGPDATVAQTGSREVWFPETGEWTPTPIYDRDRLRAGNVIEGPAVIDQMDTTTLVLPDMRATVDPWLNLLLTRR